MRLSSSCTIQVGVLLLITTLFAVSAPATTFTTASLKGNYSFLVNTWAAGSTVNQEASVGVVTFDGAGNVTASSADISGGVFTTYTLSGTYAIKSTGTGTITFTSGGAKPPVYAIVLESSAAGLAKGFYALRTDLTSNLVESGTAVFQTTAAATYSVASLKGNFGFQNNKWTADSSVNEDGAVGVFIFDGKGNVKASFSDMVGGVLETVTLTGTYTVSADGNGSISLTGGPVYLAFALNTAASATPYSAKSLQFITTTTTVNAVNSGTALKQ